MGRTEKIEAEGVIASVLAIQRPTAQVVDSARLALTALHVKWMGEVVRRWGVESQLDTAQMTEEEADTYQAYSIALMRIGSILLVTDDVLRTKEVPEFYSEADDHLQVFAGSAQEKMEYSSNNPTSSAFFSTVHTLYGQILEVLVDFT